MYNNILLLLLTWVESFVSNLSPLDFVLRLLVELDYSYVRTEETLLVDHTPTIKSVRAY